MNGLNKIYCEDCFVTMKDMPIGQCDVILTSPFYNTNKKAGKNSTITNTTIKDGHYSHVRYDTHIDNMTNEEYCDFTERLFLEFDRVLNLNGVVLYNLSYGSDNTEGMFTAINRILTNTPFTIADVIVWKKRSALPNNCSPNKLTRIWEFVFVLCRRSEKSTFNCNKKVHSYRKTGQASYENIFNFIEAKNNDGACPYNKATYSTELCEKLLSLYCPENGVVYDPFMGSGTTAVACKKMGLNYIGSEISENQCSWAENRLKEM
jgi:site-specific DNA-methyltransferase (adenine-specific)/modification methylase